MFKLVSFLAFIALLSGCFFTNKNDVVIVDKSINQHNALDQQAIPNNKPTTLKKQTAAKPTKSWSGAKQRKRFTAAPEDGFTWTIPVKATIAKHFSEKHQGLSFNTKIGQTIHAVRDGTVVYSGDKMKSHGKIIIKHPFGFYSSYTQSQSLKVTVGSKVQKGQIIATTNKQPFYFEMKKFSSSINPATYLKRPLQREGLLK